MQLSTSETTLFRTAVKDLIDQYARGEDLSKVYVERLLKTAILKVMQLPDLDDPAFDIIVEEVEEALKRESILYHFFIPVKGLDCAELPRVFGSIRFVVFNETQLRKLRSQVARHRVDQETKLHVINNLRDDPIWKAPCALVAVRAKDWQAAAGLAENVVSRGIDVLNLFSELQPYTHGWLHLPGRTSSSVMTSVGLDYQGGFHIAGTHVGPLGLVSMRKLRDSPLWKYARRFDLLLRKEKLSGAEDLLLASAQWAGRASVKPSREEAFLLYAIALESLILPATSVELSYRLQVRVARLLGMVASSRLRIAKEVKELYMTRSSIVHNGSFEVSDSDLSKMRFYTSNCLLAVLSRPKVWTGQGKQALDRWYEDQVSR